jgi:hypothetical protein
LHVEAVITQKGTAMAPQNSPGMYLIVELDWARLFSADAGKKAQRLRKIIQNQKQGIENKDDSAWVVPLKNQAALERLIHNKAGAVSHAYVVVFDK